jgi:hypothetical protein
MKKILGILVILTTLISVNGCRDESLNPVPVWESAVHGYTIFDGIAFNGNINSRPQPYEVNNALNFPKATQAAATIPFKIRWVSLDNKLTVNKIEIYVRVVESYNDKDGNPKVSDWSNPKGASTTYQAGGSGKLIATIATPAANRAWNTFSITPQQVYDAYKATAVNYGSGDVNVFSNPGRPRPAGAYFRPAEKGTNAGLTADVASDNFVVSWVLYTSDGGKFNVWEPSSICGDVTAVSEADSNCSLSFIVK